MVTSDVDRSQMHALSVGILNLYIDKYHQRPFKTLIDQKYGFKSTQKDEFRSFLKLKLFQRNVRTLML
jgi:hypothetical protein